MGWWVKDLTCIAWSMFYVGWWVKDLTCIAWSMFYVCNESDLDWLQFLPEHVSESGSHPSVHLHSQQLSLEEEGRRERENVCLLAL